MNQLMLSIVYIKSHRITKSGGIHKLNEVLVINCWFLQQSDIQSDVFWEIILNEIING